MDINTYASASLLDFLDAFHKQLCTRLLNEYGANWPEVGIYKHLDKKYFDRVLEMLQSPMRVVDMQRDPDELYGIEHLPNIIDGNWPIFKDVFGERHDDRQRVAVYLREIAELRNNLAHRRNHHLVRLDDLIRFAQNARTLLQALSAPEADHFAGIADSLVQGGTPWGTPLAGQLPPHDEIYDEFVGRPAQLRALGDWFMGDAKPIVIWGYGGAGKSALAFKFAREIQEACPCKH